MGPGIKHKKEKKHPGGVGRTESHICPSCGGVVNFWILKNERNIRDRMDGFEYIKCEKEHFCIVKYNKAHTKMKATKLEKYVTNINDKVRLSKI